MSHPEQAAETPVLEHTPTQTPIMNGNTVKSKTVTPLNGKARVKLKPIQRDLVAAGLIKETDIVQTQTSTSTSETGHTEPPLDVNPKPVETKTEPKVSPIVPRIGDHLPKAAVEKDPLDIVGPDGFTPRMRQWMAHPGFSSLLDILAHQRYMGSSWETRMLNAHVYPLAQEVEGISMTEDRQGNIVIDVGDNSAGVLWSCHTDTVHNANEQSRQRVLITQNGFLRLPHNSGHSCLGADDGTGVWLMIHMIRGGVPGRYVFHFGEERGCVGSRWLLQNRPDILEGMNFAIAFDRQGFNDIVTVQGGRRCCSTAFVDSIAPMLPPGYKGHPGVWTDTGVYIDVVPECTNLSVGYSGQHGSGEIQSLPHAYALLEALLKFDASRLVVGRNPAQQRETENREREERAQQSNYWRNHFQGEQTRTTLERPPAFLEGKAPGEKTLILRLAYHFTWQTLGAEQRDRVIAILGKNAKRKFHLTTNYVDRVERYLENKHSLEGTVGKTNTVTQMNSSTSLTSLANGGMGGNGGPVGGIDYGYGDDEGDDDPITSYGDNIPPQPRSMIELVRTYPNEVSDALEQDGMDVGELWAKIRDMLGLGGSVQ